MVQPQTFKQSPHRTPFFGRVVATPVVVISLLCATSRWPIGTATLGLTVILFLLPWISYCRWTDGDKQKFPIFPLLGGMYFISYALPLYWGARTISTLAGAEVFSNEEVLVPLCLVAAGMISLWGGMSIGLGRRLMLRNRVELAETTTASNYLRVILLGGTLSNYVSQFVFGEGGRQALIILQSIVPTAAFALLFRKYLRGECDRVDKMFLLAFMVARFMIGMSSGWLGAFVLFGFACLAVYIHERSRIPTSWLVGAALFIIFFQPSKAAFRKVFWTAEGSNVNATEKVAFWLAESMRMWSEAPSNPQIVTNLGTEVMRRLSLLEYTTNVMELTPDVVPFQHFHLYSYLAVTLVPRMFWPNKPSFNEANQWYQVSYGITEKSELGHVSMAVGVLAEGYMSFGWLGTIVVMFLIGMLLDWFQASLLQRDSGLVFNALGVALFPSFLAIEGQMVQYISGLVQAMALSLLILLPAMKVLTRDQESQAPEGVGLQPEFA